MSEQNKTVKLTKKTAKQLIDRVCPRLNIVKEITPPDVAIYTTRTGPEGLEIRCENDWYDLNGRLKLTISDGGSCITQYYYPDTLNSDFETEQAERSAAAGQARREWVGIVGLNLAHEMIDEYWEEWTNGQVFPDP